MRVKNKILLSLGTAALSAIPFISTSCGEGAKRYDQNDNKRVDVIAGFSATNRQGRALDALVEYYNTHVITSEGEYKGAYPVSVTRVSGYTTSNIVQALKVKDKTGSVGNITFNYPAAASEILSYNMGLDFDGIKGLDSFVTSFTDINKNIAGNPDNKTYVVPVSKSTSVMSINLPLLGKVLLDLEQKGVTLEGKDDANSLIKKAIDKWNSSSENGDKKMINEKYPSSAFNANTWEKIASLRENYSVSDETFKNWTDYLKFALVVRAYYDQTKVPYVITTDAFPNDFYTRVAQDGKELFPKSNSKSAEIYGGFDFTSYSTPGTEQYNELKKVFGDFFDVVNRHALIIGGEGAYASSKFQKHEYIVAIGSSAGASYNYLADKGETISSMQIKEISNGTETWKELSDNFLTDEEKKSVSSYGASFKLKSGTSDLLNIAFIDGTYTNNIHLDQEAATAAKVKRDNNNKLKYDGILANEDQKNVVQQVFNSLEDKNSKFLIILEDHDNDESNNVVKVVNGKVVYKDKQFGEKSKFVGTIDFRGKQKDFYLIDPSDVKIVVSSNSSFVNKDEVYNLLAPSKATKDDANNYYVGQGPSIIGIHANAKEDESTRKFVQWFITGTINEISIKLSDSKSATYTNKTPIDIFNEHGNYLSTTKSFFENATGAYAKSGTFENLIFNSFKQIADHPETNKLVEDPGTPKADTVRKNITSAIKTLMNRVNNGNTKTKEESFNDFLNSIKLK
ncbi:P68 family surface lipoprotein [Mycoplasmopsis gallinacea]|uniref:P80 family lipoprotein n=1 Tax=Mycoplasmopsis gallinacea TaxID=29556 RepID=A0A6H0V1J8_9BACT|nr:P80 family lipoprotein [Mycoplasmopsis gallinacea]QIW62220.1 P80 family lipoprotein [Mycoplasmopsis gallinacea]